MFGNDFFDELGSYKNIMLFQISSRRESRENLSHQDESSYKNFLQTIRYRIQHLGLLHTEFTCLPLLRTLLTIHQKSRESGF